MGFWDVTKRILQGKPAFEVSESYKQEEDAWRESDPETDAPSVDDASEVADQNGHRVHHNMRIGRDGQKVFAEAEIIEVKPRDGGANIQLWVTIRNNSQFAIQLDKINALGTTQELGYPLQPSGMRDFMIYNGLNLTSDAYKYAELYYRDQQSGDYFCATHVIAYDHRSDGAYEVTEMKLARPIKDV